MSKKIHGFTLKSRFKWVEAYPLISEVHDVYEATTEDIDNGFMKLVASKNIGHVLRLQEKWEDIT